MLQTLNYHYQKILKELEVLPDDKLIEIEDFIEFLKEKYISELMEEPKDFLDQIERNIAKSSLYSRKS
ncbi:MAG: DUF2281 domain-containing protein [Nitrospinae bacterium]|nr:DUF2281 domain-containing protein [Nitrospinota bacterium]MBI3813040.1 DUF2281 domain-containing protein [Nitrospinota bacterium]